MYKKLQKGGLEMDLKKEKILMAVIVVLLIVVMSVFAIWLLANKAEESKKNEDYTNDSEVLKPTGTISTPEPTKVSPTVTPEPAATSAPTVTHEPTVTVESTATPGPTAVAEQPTATIAPTSTPKPTKAPDPTVILEPTATPVPMSTPEPTATSVPTVTPKPTKAPNPTSTPKPTKAPDKDQPLPTFGPVGESQHVPLDSYSKEKLPEEFSTEEQLTDWLARRTVERHIGPLAKKYDYSEGALELVKVKETNEWTFCRYMISLTKGQDRIDVCFSVNGGLYVDLLNAYDLFVCVSVECFDKNGSFCKYEQTKNKWPQEGLEFFFKLF